MKRGPKLRLSQHFSVTIDLMNKPKGQFLRLHRALWFGSCIFGAGLLCRQNWKGPKIESHERAKATTNCGSILSLRMMQKKELDYKSSLFLSSCYCCLASQQTKKLSWYVAKASQQQRLYDSQNWDTRDILPLFLERWELLLTANASEIWKRYHKTYSQWWILNEEQVDFYELHGYF